MRHKEIKFRDQRGELVGRQNGMRFIISKSLGAPAREPTYWVTILPGQGECQVTSGGREDFSLEGAKAFCQRVAAGEIKLEDLRAKYAAEDDAREQAVIREVTGKARKFQKRLDAVGLRYTDLLELEVLAHSLGNMGHNILLDYEHGKGWPSGT